VALPEVIRLPLQGLVNQKFFRNQGGRQHPEHGDGTDQQNLDEIDFQQFSADAGTLQGRSLKEVNDVSVVHGITIAPAL